MKTRPTQFGVRENTASSGQHAPEGVIRRIADYRGEEKHARYAQYTVEKAQGQLQQIKSTPEQESRTPEVI